MKKAVKPSRFSMFPGGQTHRFRLNWLLPVYLLLILFSFSSCKNKAYKEIHLDPSLYFVDEHSKKITLGDYLYQGKPIILTPVYYKCPSVCNLQLNRLAESIQSLGYSLEKDLVLVSVSFNTAETPEIAFQKKGAYAEKYNLSGMEGWHFLTGEFSPIKALTKSIGFEYYIDKESREFIHKPVTYIFDSEGNLKHILPGSKQPASVLRLMLANASKGKLGTVADRMLWFFLDYNEEKEEFRLDYWNAFRFIFALFLIMFFVIKKVPLKMKL